MSYKDNRNGRAILNFLKNYGASSSGEVHEGLRHAMSLATAKRQLNALLDAKYILSEGNGRGRKFLISPSYQLFAPIESEGYFLKDQEERLVYPRFNFDLLDEILPGTPIFSSEELERLQTLQGIFAEKTNFMGDPEFQDEMERLAIDLSWKSSVIEGNTYSLLETEALLKEKERVEGKSYDDAIMLLNHKKAIDFILEQTDYMKSLSVLRIEDLHSMLIRDLNVRKGIRQRPVAITGTSYRPLDNEHQIREAIDKMCTLINGKESVFERAFLTMVMISYIQAFADGNKRTGRILCNAVLISENHCPLSFRTVNSVAFKQAMVIFYEINNLTPLKKIFMDQFEFAVHEYF